MAMRNTRRFTKWLENPSIKYETPIQQPCFSSMQFWRWNSKFIGRIKVNCEFETYSVVILALVVDICEQVILTHRCPVPGPWKENVEPNTAQNGEQSAKNPTRTSTHLLPNSSPIPHPTSSLTSLCPFVHLDGASSSEKEERWSRCTTSVGEEAVEEEEEEEEGGQRRRPPVLTVAVQVCTRRTVAAAPISAAAYRTRSRCPGQRCHGILWKNRTRTLKNIVNREELCEEHASDVQKS